MYICMYRISPPTTENIDFSQLNQYQSEVLCLCAKWQKVCDDDDDDVITQNTTIIFITVLSIYFNISEFWKPIVWDNVSFYLDFLYLNKAINT